MIRLLAAFMLALVVAPAAHAGRVTPMVVTIDADGSGTVARIEVTNTAEETLPLELRAFRGLIGERGEVELTPADEQFLIYPPQVTVEAGRTQIFRVQYLPDQPLDQSEVFYVAVRELPVQLDPGVSRIQVVTNFNVLVNVVPDGVAAAPTVDWVRPAEREGQSGIEVRVTNSGKRFFAAGRTGWEIKAQTPQGEPVAMDFASNSAGSTFGYGIVPPGQSRIFFVPTASPVSETDLSARILE